MTDTQTFVLGLVAAVPATVAAAIAALASRRNATKIEELHLVVNSRLTQLLETTKAAAHAEGMIEQSKVPAPLEAQAVIVASALEAKAVIAAAALQARAPGAPGAS